MRRGALTALLLCASACQQPHAKHAAVTTIASCDYDVKLSADGLARVTASCAANGPIAFRLTEDYLASSVHGPGRRKATRFPSADKRLTYVVDLAHLAKQGRDFDRALHVGASFFAPMSNVLVVPEPLTTEIPVKVHVSAETAARRRDRAGAGHNPEQLPTDGARDHQSRPTSRSASCSSVRSTSPAPKLEVSALDGPLDQSFADVSDWIRTSANAVRDFYGAFPVPRASVTVLPTPGVIRFCLEKCYPKASLASPFCWASTQRATPCIQTGSWSTSCFTWGSQLLRRRKVVG